jgi:hypothetical protein
MPASCRAVKAFSVALLILSMAVAVSAQSVAELKKQATAGDTWSQAQVADKTLSSTPSAREV